MHSSVADVPCVSPLLPREYITHPLCSRSPFRLQCDSWRSFSFGLFGYPSEWSFGQTSDHLAGTMANPLCGRMVSQNPCPTATASSVSWEAGQIGHRGSLPVH